MAMRQVSNARRPLTVLAPLLLVLVACGAAPKLPSAVACPAGPASSAPASSSASAPTSSAAPPSVVGVASALAPPVASAAPRFPTKTVETDLPRSSIKLPIFTFPDDAASDALLAWLERDALAEQQRFVSHWRSARDGGVDTTELLFSWICTPTLARPRLASVHCWGMEFLRPNVDVHWVTEATYAIDGAKVRRMKPEEFFSRDAKGDDRWLKLVSDHVNGVMGSCTGKAIPERTVEASIDGFSVTAEGMLVHVSSATIGVCGAKDFEVDIAWNDHPAMIDPKGAITRIRP